MANSTSSSSGGIGFCGLLTVVFITLKLTGKIDWAWIWVLAPIWITFSCIVIFLICLGIFILVSHMRRR